MLEGGELGRLEPIEEVALDPVEVGRGGVAEPVEPGMRQEGLLAAGIRLAGDPLDAALGLEAVDEPGDAAARQEDPLGEDVHPDPPAGRRRDLEQGVVFREGQAVGRLELVVEPAGDPGMSLEEAPPRGDPGNPRSARRRDVGRPG